MARRRNAGKSLAQVWERQRELKLLANRVSGALTMQINWTNPLVYRDYQPVLPHLCSASLVLQVFATLYLIVAVASYFVHAALY